MKIENIDENNIVEVLEKTKEIWKQIDFIAIGLVNSINIKDEDNLMVEVMGKNDKFKELFSATKLVFQKLKEKGVNVPLPFEKFIDVREATDKLEVRDLHDIMTITKLHKELGYEPFDILFESLRDTELFLDECIFKAKHHALLPANNQIVSTEKIKFDGLNMVLKCGDINHAFHQNSYYGKLFKKLWEERREIKNNKVIKNGKPFPAYALANQIGLTESPREFTGSPEIKEKFRNTIKGLKRIMRTKKFPITIEVISGIQLIIKQ
jgi:hypothetical protein